MAYAFVPGREPGVTHLAWLACVPRWGYILARLPISLLLAARTRSRAEFATGALAVPLQPCKRGRLFLPSQSPMPRGETRRYRVRKCLPLIILSLAAEHMYTEWDCPLRYHPYPMAAAWVAARPRDYSVGIYQAEDGRASPRRAEVRLNA